MCAQIIYSGPCTYVIIEAKATLAKLNGGDE